MKTTDVKDAGFCIVFSNDFGLLLFAMYFFLCIVSYSVDFVCYQFAITFGVSSSWMYEKGLLTRASGSRDLGGHPKSLL